MGRVYVTAEFYNPVEYAEYIQGKRKLGDLRKVEERALVDTGATFPALPHDLVVRLGLPFMGKHEAEVATGKEELELVMGTVKIDNRIATCHLIVRPTGTTPLIGVVALEQMGYRVDPTTGRLIRGLPLML
ncbi:MAG: hypothetical protein ACE5Z5_07465 [Candidatus Bathyarchaeia archaeon]